MLDKGFSQSYRAFGFSFLLAETVFLRCFLLPVVEKGFFFLFGCEYGKINFEYEFQGSKACF